MIIDSIKNRIRTKAAAAHDFRTSRHIVVFESDDWGSIRMSDKQSWEELLKKGYAVDKRPYERFDTLESPEDLVALFEVLSKYKDSNGNHPVITANMLMANPDFERIEKSGFQDYHFETIAQTYSRYFGDDRVLEVMRQGHEEGVFMPQSHGREHFNAAQWMRGLRAGDEDLMTAFHYGICGIAPKTHPETGNKLMNALRAENEEEQKQINGIVKEGLQMFEQLWGFKSKTFVAPCFCWNVDVERVLANNNVELIQTARFKKAAYKSPTQYYFSGEKNMFNQTYSIRNCTFEPATAANESDVCRLIKQVEKVFGQHRIAVFSTHRINYASGLFEQNRKNTLSLLDGFLKELLKVYPDVEFLSSDRLIEVLA